MGIGGSGARLFLGASEGRVLEMYGLEMVLDLVKDGRCLLTSGVAGALAVCSRFFLLRWKKLKIPLFSFSFTMSGLCDIWQDSEKT